MFQTISKISRAHASRALLVILAFAVASGFLQAQTKAIALSPSTLTFPLTVKGKTSGAQSITVTSTGNATVTFSGFTVTGADASDFAISANTCGATLASGATCLISLTFTPAAVGSRAATLNVADDATGSPQTASLIGSSASIVFNLRPASVTYPVVMTGSSSTPVQITVTNAGVNSATISSIALGAANPGDFVIGSKTCGTTLAAGASCTVNVSFAPTANGIRTANLVLTDTAAGSPQSVPLTGTAESATQNLIFSPTALTFNSVNVNTLSLATLNVTNYGNTGTIFSGMAISGANAADFGVVSNSCNPLAPGAGCSIVVAFRPSAPGLRSGLLVLSDTAAGSPQSVPLSGSGYTSNQMLTFSPTALAFQAQTVGTNATLSMSISNFGTSGVLFTSFSLTGTNAADFLITSNSCPQGTSLLQPQASCSIGLAFTPSAAGERTATLSIADNATGSPQLIPLSGVGETSSKQLLLSTGTLSLGATPVGTTSGNGQLVAQSIGDAPVTLSSLTLSGADASEFTITSTNCLPGQVFQPNSQCYVYVGFTPAAAGVRTATLTFKDDAKGSPQAVTLEGVGQTDTQQLGFNYVNVDFGVLDLGAASSQETIQVTNNGDVPVTFTSVSATGANASDFSIRGDSCVSAGPLTPNSVCDVYLSLTPSAAGVRTAQLVFTDSATGSPQSVALSGYGQALTQTLSFYSPSTVFSGQTINTTSSSTYNYLNNTGDAPVVFSSITITGGNAGDFALVNQSCPIGGAGLSASNYCTFYVNFTPSALGTRTSTLQFVDTATGSPQTIPLVGVGTPATLPLILSPTDVGYGDQNVSTTSAATTVNISNPGNSALSLSVALSGANAADFTILTNNCGASLGASASCSLTVTFKPSGLGLRIAALKFTAGGAVLYDGLSGVGTTADKVITTAQNALDFGPYNVGSTSGQTYLEIDNTGTQTVTFSSFGFGGTNPGDFAISNNNCGSTLAVGGYCYLYVTFTPTAAGVRTATVQIGDDAPGSPQSVPVTGVGQTPTKVLDLPPAVAMPVTNIGSTVSQYIYINNVGTATVTITSSTITGTNAGDFAVSQDYCTGGGSLLSPNGYCYYQVSFTPTAAGTRTATLTITDDAVGSPQSISLTGFGQTLTQTLALPPALAIPLTTVGSSNNNSYFYIINSGTAPVTITATTIIGANAADFAIGYTSCGSSLAGNASCYFDINFTPSAAGVRSATFQITDSATGSPQTVALSGVGQTSTKILSVPPVVSEPATNVGATNSDNYFYIYSEGTGPVTLSNMTITGANASDFAISYESCSIGLVLNPGGECYIDIAFTPSGSGNRSATFQLTDDANGGSQSVALTGVGQGVTDTASVSPSALAYGTYSVGGSSGDQYTYLYNTGSDDITISSIAVTGPNSGDFLIDYGSCSVGNSLSPGSYCYVAVYFQPTAAGNRTATLQFTDNAVGTVQSVALSGAGQ